MSDQDVTDAVMDLRDDWNSLGMGRRIEIADLICKLLEDRDRLVQVALGTVK